MVILEVSSLNAASGFANVEPFIYEIRPGGVTYASWWVDVFGLPDYSRDYSIVIQTFIRDLTIFYQETDSYANLLLTQGSFFWDNLEQILYIHFEHNYEGWNATYQYGSFWGFSDNDVVYLDNIQYSPNLLSSPSFSQSQDIVNYEKPSFMSGSVVLSNGEILTNGKPTGINDSFISSNVYNNDVWIYYYPDEMLDEFGNGSRDDLVRLGAFYIEDYETTLQKITFFLQDKRKAQDVDILDEVFTISEYPNIDTYEDQSIPLLYGQVREIRGIPINSSIITGNVDFRPCLSLSSIGTVQVDIDGIWTTVSPINLDLANGLFSLSSANGRNANGSLRDCKLLNPIGEVINKSSDIIVGLNEKYLGIPFIESFYNTTEWTNESANLSNGGYLFDSPMKLYDAIKVIQDGSSKGFRYEINPEGKRTIRIDDNSRLTSGRITNTLMQNQNTLPVRTRSKNVYAYINIKHSKSFYSGRYFKEPNSDNAQSILENFKSANSYTQETILNNSVDASDRASYDAERFSFVPKISSVDLMGKEFLDLRIFDIKNLELCTGFADVDNDKIEGRDYYGFVDAKIISINPDPKTLKNKIKFLLLE